ncbi:MAG: DUF393 domain-containing protein [Verrucomicrobiales bacterium]|nr:DUF393 domain-containing protein [Verrucomicrobiales bacterium]
MRPPPNRNPEAAPTEPRLRPVVIYDGDCGFCRRSVAKLRQITDDGIECVDRLDPVCATRFPHLLPSDLETAVHFVGIDGRVSRGAEAVLRAAALNPRWRWLLRWYSASRILAWIAEVTYRGVARNRALVSRLTRYWLPESPDVPQGRGPSTCSVSRKGK